MLAINLTDAAVSRIKQICAEDSVAPSIRVKVLGGGCAGFSYDMSFEDSQPSDSDEVIQISDISLRVDPISLQYIEGTTIDYVDTVMASGFKFHNPKSTGSCGCGSSFSA